MVLQLKVCVSTLVRFVGSIVSVPGTNMAKGRGLVAQALVSRRGQPSDLKGEEGEEEEEAALKLMLQSNSGWSPNFTFYGEYCKETPRYDKKKGEGMAKPGVNRMAAVKQVIFFPAD